MTARVARKRQPSTHCRKGVHALTPDNIRWRRDRRKKSGRERQCLACLKAAQTRVEVERKAERAKTKKPTAKERREAAIQEVWARLLRRPDNQYTIKMLEAKREMDEWDAQQKANRMAKKGTKGRTLACGANNP